MMEAFETTNTTAFESMGKSDIFINQMKAYEVRIGVVNFAYEEGG